MISETMIRYGSRVWRQGKSRPCPANHSSSAPRIVAKVSGGRLKRELLLSVISLYYINYRTYAVGVLPGGLEGRVPTPRGYPVPLQESFSFARVGRLCRPTRAKIRDLGGGKPPPNPHRVSPVIKL